MATRGDKQPNLLSLTGAIVGGLVSFKCIYRIGAAMSNDLSLDFLSALAISAWFSVTINDLVVRYFVQPKR